MEAVTQSELPTSILLVDDEPINLSVFGQHLAPYYNILVATSGNRALQLAQATPKPDLILLDVMMPGMDGYEVIGQLKANPDTADIPVIFITAMSSEQEEERGLKLGAVDYLYKPCHLPILLARIRTHLELKCSRDRLKNQNALLEVELERRIQDDQQVQLQLLQSEKLAAVGQLAAGITHEINNPVGFVNSNLYTLNTYAEDVFCVIDAYEAAVAALPAESETLKNLKTLKQQKDLDFLRSDMPVLIGESLEGLVRVREIIQSLKDFSHTENNQWVLANLHKGIDSTLTIIWNELKYHCNIHKEYGEIPEIVCLPTQLNQVFMNLLVNAAQAIEKQGDIIIRTRRHDQEVWVEVIDNGLGIAPEELAHLFEPFYTTKPVGKGTGLGLSISQSIIHKHGGRIEVDSEIGQGSTFRVCLPIKEAGC